MKVIKIIVILLGLVLVSYGDERDIPSYAQQDIQKAPKDLMQIDTLSVGINLATGSMMGANLEFSFPLIKAGMFEWRNALSIGGGALKLRADSDMDTNFLLFSEKMTFGILAGSSLGAHLGFVYFRPYLFIGGGFGLLYAKDSISFGQSPYYYEATAGVGHEFITEGGHTLFFEFGGGYASLTKKIISGALGGFTRIWIGYRYYF